jgi:hypothetical protein
MEVARASLTRLCQAAAKIWWHISFVAKTRKTKPFQDVAAVCGKDEHGLHILRRREEDGPIEAGIVRPLEEGKPISGEVISMRQRDDVPFLFDVTTEVSTHSEDDTSANGPAQVASDSYRRGWDAIWGQRTRSPRALN